MKSIVSINGIPTPIDIPDGNLTVRPNISGGKENYTIDYNNGILETGGIVDIQTSVVKDGVAGINNEILINNVLEGVTKINLPFSNDNLLDFQVTAINVATSADVLYGESAFYQEVSEGINIYATAFGSTPTTIKVKWYAKGIKNQ